MIDRYIELFPIGSDKLTDISMSIYIDIDI